MDKKRVLVIDDSATVRQELSQILESIGFEVLQAQDGVAGLEAIHRHPDLGLVLCDVNMPRMTGIEMLSKLQSELPQHTFPVLMLTSEGQPALIQEAKRLGAKGWLVKPFNPDHLAAVAKKFAGLPG